MSEKTNERGQLVSSQEVTLGNGHTTIGLQETLDEGLRTARSAIKASLMASGPGKFVLTVWRIEE